MSGSAKFVPAHARGPAPPRLCVSICTFVLVNLGTCAEDGPLETLRQYLYLCTSKSTQVNLGTCAEDGPLDGRSYEVRREDDHLQQPLQPLHAKRPVTNPPPHAGKRHLLDRNASLYLK